MEDVQSHAPQVALNIDRVGVRELKLPLLVRDRCQGTQQTVATVDLGVDLPSSFKGTHMSRFVEALEQWNDEISYQSVRRLLVNIKERLGARRAYARFCFPYFIVKKAPASGSPATVAYECRLTGELDDKAIVVMENSPFAKVKSIAELDAKFPGVTTILQTWFTSYKGYGKDGKLMLSSPGFKDRATAIKLIGDAILDYEMSVVTEADKRPLDPKGNPYLYRSPLARNIGE